MAAKNVRKKRKCRLCKGDSCIHQQTHQNKDVPLLTEQSMEIFQKLLKDKENSPAEILKIGAHQEELFNFGIDPTCVVAAVGDTEAMRRFLDAGANINEKCLNDGSTPLMLAAQGRNLEMVELLLRHGADVTTLNKDKNHALMLAIKTGAADIVNALWPYRKDLDMNHANVEGMTMLHYAAEKTWTVCVKFLLTNGSSINAKSNAGRTPLIISAMNGDSRTTRTLLTSGADYLIEDNGGLTALCWAVSSDKKEIVKLILDKMQPRDREQFVKNRIDRMRKPSEKTNTDAYYNDVLIPLMLCLSNTEKFREALRKQKFVSNLLAVFQKHIKNHTLLSGALSICCQCMNQHESLVDEQFTQQFIRARGPDICLKILNAYDDTHKGDPSIMVTCFFPLVCISETQEGKEWIEKNSTKVAQHMDLKPQPSLLKCKWDNIEEKCNTLWQRFSTDFEKMQLWLSDRKMAELLEEEEKEKFRKSKQKEKKKEKRKRLHQNRVTTKQTTQTDTQVTEEVSAQHRSEKYGVKKKFQTEIEGYNITQNKKDAKESRKKEFKKTKIIVDKINISKTKAISCEEQKGVGKHKVSNLNSDHPSIKEIMELSNLNSYGGNWVAVQGKKKKQKTNSCKLEFGDFDIATRYEIEEEKRKRKAKQKERTGKKKKCSDIAKFPKYSKEVIKSSELPPAATAGFDVAFGVCDFEEEFPALGCANVTVKRDCEKVGSEDFSSTDNTGSDEWKNEIYLSPSVSIASSESSIDNTSENTHVTPDLTDCSVADLKEKIISTSTPVEITKYQLQHDRPNQLSHIAKSVLIDGERKQGPMNLDTTIVASENAEDLVKVEDIFSNGMVFTSHQHQNIIKRRIQQLPDLEKNVHTSVLSDLQTEDTRQDDKQEQRINQASRSGQNNIAVIQPIGNTFGKKNEVKQENNQKVNLSNASTVGDISIVDSLLRNVAALQVNDDNEDILFPKDLRSPSKTSLQSNESNEQNNTEEALPVFPGFHDDTQTAIKAEDINKRLDSLLLLQLANYYQLKCTGDGIDKSLYYHDFPYYSSAMGISEETVKAFIQKRQSHNANGGIDTQRKIVQETCNKTMTNETTVAPLQQPLFRAAISNDKKQEMTFNIVHNETYKQQNTSHKPDRETTSQYMIKTNQKPTVYSENKYEQSEECQERRLKLQKTIEPEIKVQIDEHFNNHLGKWTPRSIRWSNKLSEIWNMSQLYIKQLGDIFFPRDYKDRYTIPYSDEAAVLGFMRDGTEIAVHVIDLNSRKVTPDLLNKLTSSNLSYYFLVKYRGFAIEGNTCYLAMDLPEYTLVEYLGMLQLDISLDPLSVNKMVWQLIKGLASLHNNCGLLHGNLMPSNVLVDVDGKLRLSEYGLPPRSRGVQPLISSVSVHADRDCWVPPEVATEAEEYSTKSDIQVTGMILYSIMSGGIHPYGENNLEIQVSIHQNWPKMIYLSEEANDLLSTMMCMPPIDRPGANELLRHPYFWAEEKRLRFVLIVGSDVLRDLKQGFLKNGGAGETMIDILTHGSDDLSRKDWMSVVDPVIRQEMCSFRQYKNNLVELVLFTYNCCLHFDKLSQKARDQMDEPCKYFLTKFPSLFMSVYRAIKNSERSQKTCYKPFF